MNYPGYLAILYTAGTGALAWYSWQPFAFWG